MNCGVELCLVVPLHEGPRGAVLRKEVCMLMLKQRLQKLFSAPAAGWCLRRVRFWFANGPDKTLGSNSGEIEVVKDVRFQRLLLKWFAANALVFCGLRLRSFDKADIKIFEGFRKGLKRRDGEARY